MEEGGECPGSDNEKDMSSTSRSCVDRSMREKTAPFKRVSGTVKILEESFISVKRGNEQNI